MRPTLVNGVLCTDCGREFERFARFESHDCRSSRTVMNG